MYDNVQYGEENIWTSPNAFPLLKAPSSAFIHTFIFRLKGLSTKPSPAGGLIDYDSEHGLTVCQ